MKILNVFLVSMFTLVGFGFAAELSISPMEGKLGLDCIIPFDIMVDSLDQEVAAIDVILDSSMDYINFVAGDFLPYVFPPRITENGQINILSFSLDKELLSSGTGKLGTIYFRPDRASSDGFIKFYVRDGGGTTDSNISMLGGIDILAETIDGFYTFDSEACIGTDGSEIIEGMSNVPYEEELKSVLKNIEKDTKKTNFIQIGLVSLLVLLLLSVIVFAFRRNKKGRKFQN